MKRFLSVLLVLTLLLSMSLLSCESKPDNQKEDNEEEKEPVKELTAEEKAIMDDLIFLMEDDTYDTDELIGKFFCDFTIDRFDGADLPYSRIYKSGDVLAVENKNNETNYQIVKNSKLCAVIRTNDGAKLHLESEQEYPYDYPLSIFTAFGIDMSSIYSPSEAAEDEPEVTYDSLTVAKDKKSVVFSDEYLADVAKFLCSSIEPNKPSDDEMKKFVNEMTASGVYTLDDQTAKFSIEGAIESFGNIKLETSFSFEGKKPSSILTSISVAMENDGAIVNATNEVNIRNMTYENDELVSLTVEHRELTNLQSTEDSGTIEATFFTVGTYDFMLENSLPSSVSIMVNQEQNTKINGTQAANSSSSLTFFVKDNNLAYDISQNGLQQSYIAAEGVAFKAPDNVTIPEDIYTVLPK